MKWEPLWPVRTSSARSRPSSTSGRCASRKIDPATAPPESVEYYDKVATWPMYYNNKYGDCTCAAAAHMIQNWTANAGTEISPPAPKVLAFYEHFVGSPTP